jgi:glucose-1-phosphate cytidylyltransferase
MNFKTAIILCGGRGTRLGQLGKKIPKSLLEIQGKPIIWYIIKSLKKNSFNHFILPVGYKANMIKKYFKKNKEFKKINIEIINTGKNTSISKRIFKIKKFIKSKNIILLNGDGIFNFNLKKIYKNHEKVKNYITFLGSEAQLPYGIVGIKNKKIVSFEREASFNAILSNKKNNFIGHIYSGISILRKDLLNLHFKTFDNFEKKFYPIVIKKFKSSFKNIDGFWYSVDNQKDLMYLNDKKNKLFYKIIKNLKTKLIK